MVNQWYFWWICNDIWWISDNILCISDILGESVPIVYGESVIIYVTMKYCDSWKSIREPPSSFQHYQLALVLVTFPLENREREPDERTSGSFTDSYEENMEVIPYHRCQIVSSRPVLDRKSQENWTLFTFILASDIHSLKSKQKVYFTLWKNARSAKLSWPILLNILWI